MSPMGRQWFALTFRDPDERWRGVNHAGPALDKMLDKELAHYGLPPESLALVGFSQGCMMALHVGLRRAVAPAAIVGYSGGLIGPEHLAEQIRAQPPVLLVHGTHDDVVPFDALFMSAQALAKAGASCEFHISHGLGHGIDGEGLRQGGEFLAAAFRQAGRRAAQAA